MKIESFGDRALLVSDLRDPVAAVPALKEGFLDARVRAGMDAVLIEFAAPRSDLMEMGERTEAVLASPSPVSATSAREYVVPMRYDGIDLDSAAHELGVATDQLIEAHRNVLWRVAMIGFAPGFPYLTPVGEQIWEIPRLATPRARVPAGSVAIAAGMCAIYPTAMPGGWHLIGTTDLRLFDAGTEPPSLLAAGDLVRFREIP